MSLKEIWKKQGGMKLIQQYARGGALITAVGEFVLLGRSRTALEILRLSTQLKVKQKLNKRYGQILESFDRNYIDLDHISSDYVWICWFQGLDHAPEIVQRCFQSVVDHMPDKKVTLITEENLFEYVQFPEYIIDKWKKGIITNTHMTDLIRLELLIRFGGLWLDATVFCSDCHIPNYFFKSELFMYQCLKPGRDGHANYISSWLICARTNSKILMAVREMCYAYWKENNTMWDYFLFHDFMAIVLDRYPEELLKMVPRDNATPHILLLRLFEKYDERTWTAIKMQTPFHKLSYKLDSQKMKLEDTYYSILLR